MFWILVLSYWLHLLATVVWFGSLLLLGLTAVPALRRGSLDRNGWLTVQRRLFPWANLSLVLLLITGFLQLTTDANYNGFLAVDSLWAWAMLVKHIAYVVVVVVAAYVQFGLYPALNRAHILAEKRPQLAEKEQERLALREKRLLWLNLLCAVVILFCTAVATAI